MPTKRTPRRILHLDWKPHFENVFTLVDAAWARPKTVKVTATKTRSIWEARFVAQDGSLRRLRVRLAHLADGSAEVLEESVSVSWSVSSRDLKAARDAAR